MGSVNKRAVRFIINSSHGQYCCYMYVYNDLEEKESFYSLGKAYFIGNGGELLLGS